MPIRCIITPSTVRIITSNRVYITPSTVRIITSNRVYITPFTVRIITSNRVFITPYGRARPDQAGRAGAMQLAPCLGRVRALSVLDEPLENITFSAAADASERWVVGKQRLQTILNEKPSLRPKAVKLFGGLPLTITRAERPDSRSYRIKSSRASSALGESVIACLAWLCVRDRGL